MRARGLLRREGQMIRGVRRGKDRVKRETQASITLMVGRCGGKEKRLNSASLPLTWGGFVIPILDRSDQDVKKKTSSYGIQDTGYRMQVFPASAFDIFD
jgi:hypothetical protein